MNKTRKYKKLSCCRETARRIRRPRYGCLRQNIAILFGVQKLERYGYALCGGEHSLRICLIVETEYQRVTDRQTDRQADGR